MKTLNGYEVVDAKAREDIKGIQAAVEAIPEYDLTPYATKSELPTKVSQLQNDSKFITLEEVPETDLSEYAKKSELPTVPKKVSELTNDAGYITAAEVPKTDLSAYAKKTDIPDVSGFITSIPSEYVTESELNAKGYLTQHQDISHLAPKTSIPTKVSQLANDSNYLTSIPSNYITEAELEAKGYLTEHQSLAAYATKTYVDNTVAENQPNLSGYAKKTDIPDVSGFISEIPSEYVTDSELAAKGYLVEADLSEYAKKSEIPTVPTKTSQLTNDSNFLTAVPSEYITETELNNKGYLTEHQSLSEYAKKSEIPDVSHFITSIPEEYVTETELNNKGYLTQHQSLEGYATKTYVDDAIAGIDIPGGGNSSIVYLDIRSIGTSYEPAPQEAITLAKDLLAGKSLIVYLRTSDTEYRQADIKCGTSSVELFAAPKINVNNGDATQGICVIQNFSSNGVEDWHAYKAIDTRPALVTQSELDTAIAGINIPGGTSKEAVEIPFGNTFPTAMQDKLKEIWLYGAAGNNILDKYEIYIINAAGKINCRANSVYCYGSETDSDDYKRFTVSAQESESILLSCNINPYISKISLHKSERIVTESYLESNFSTWQSDTSVDTVYCRWNWNSPNVRMVKLIGQVSGETDHYATFEIAAPNGSSFNTNTYHQVPNLLGVKSSGDYNTYNFLQVYYTGSYFELQNPEGTNCSDRITPVAMYYLK